MFLGVSFDITPSKIILPRTLGKADRTLSPKSDPSIKDRVAALAMAVAVDTAPFTTRPEALLNIALLPTL
jgi:hypothetical protein